MNTCPHCKIHVGGSPTSCPLCQSQLLGEGEPPRYPSVEPEQRRYSLAYKIVAFVLLTATVICVAIDLLGPDTPVSWSIPVILGVAGTLILLRVMMKRRRNAPKLLFQTLVLVSVVLVLCDLATGWHRFSVDYVVPILCTVALVLNSIFGYINRHFTENGLVYLLLNIVVGALPYLAFLLSPQQAPVAWTVCLIVGIITFLSLVIFKGRDLWTELQKRLHL